MGRRASQTDSYDMGDATTAIIFSFADGFVWASWPGTAAKVRLGRHENVTAMMRDFLAQSELGERLANSTPRPDSARLT
jgi:hypothetical protein